MRRVALDIMEVVRKAIVQDPALGSRKLPTSSVRTCRILVTIPNDNHLHPPSLVRCQMLSRGIQHPLSVEALCTSCFYNCKLLTFELNSNLHSQRMTFKSSFAKVDQLSSCHSDLIWLSQVSLAGHLQEGSDCVERTQKAGLWNLSSIDKFSASIEWEI